MKDINPQVLKQVNTKSDNIKEFFTKEEDQTMNDLPWPVWLSGVSTRL